MQANWDFQNFFKFEFEILLQIQTHCRCLVSLLKPRILPKWQNFGKFGRTDLKCISNFLPNRLWPSERRLIFWRPQRRPESPEVLRPSPNRPETRWRLIKIAQNRYKWIFFEPTCDCHKRKFAFSLDAYPFCQLYKLYIIHMKYRQGK